MAAIERHAAVLRGGLNMTLPCGRSGRLVGQRRCGALDSARRVRMPHAQLAGNPTATLKLNFPVADLTGDLPAGADREASAHDEVTLVDAADFRFLDLAAPDEAA